MLTNAMLIAKTKILFMEFTAIDGMSGDLMGYSILRGTLAPAME